MNESISILENDRQVGELPAERFRLDTSTDVLSPNFRLDFNTARVPDGTLYSAASPGFLFHSHDDGRSWQRWLLTEMAQGDWQSSDKWLGQRIRGFGISGDDLLLLVDDTASKQPGLSVACSRDGGETWEHAGRIDPSPFDRVAADASGFYCLPDGSILLSVQLSYVSETGKEEDLPEEKQGIWSHIYRSQDNGQTWSEKYPVGDQTCETQLLLKQDGSMLAVIRRQGNLPEGIWKTLFLSDSLDMGRTWENLRQFSPEVGSCHGEALQLSDGRVILLYHKRYPYTDGDIRAHVSHDGGKTWEPQIYIVCKGHGYPGSVVLPDDTIVTVTGDEQMTENAKVIPPGHTAQTIRWQIT